MFAEFCWHDPAALLSSALSPTRNHSNRRNDHSEVYIQGHLVIRNLRYLIHHDHRVNHHPVAHARRLAPTAYQAKTREMSVSRYSKLSCLSDLNKRAFGNRFRNGLSAEPQIFQVHLNRFLN